MNGAERTLLLNATMEPLAVVTSRRAINLMLAGKAEVVKESDVAYHSARSAIKVPAVLRLLRAVVVPFRRSAVLTTRTVLVRDNHECGYCGRKATTIDHIKPRSKGGEHKWENTVAACYNCNHLKSDMDLQDFLELQGLEGLRFQPYRPRGILAWMLTLPDRDRDAWQPYLRELAIIA